MPEANVLRLTADRLGEALIGEPLISAELRWPTIASANLVGTTVVESVSLGKHLLTRLDTGQTLHTHLRMDGFWRLARTGSREAAGRAHQIRAVLATAHWTALGWHLGMMDLLDTRDEATVVGHLGPDILDPGFIDSTAADGGLREALRRLYGWPREPNPPDSARPPGSAPPTPPDAAPALARPICAALLDQRVVAGIGTIYMAEPLWQTGTWPWTPVGELAPQRAARVLATASYQLDRAVRIGKTKGMRAVPRNVHGQHLRFCTRCDTPIAVGSLEGPHVAPDQGTGNRIVFYCPTCQAPPAVPL